MNTELKAFLLFALQHFNIKVSSENDHFIFLEKNYCIEIEKNGLLKLSQGSQVIAPFADVEALCNFIKKDIELNEKN